MQEIENIRKNSGKYAIWLYLFLLKHNKAMIFLVLDLEANNVFLWVYR
jgi:hypothetical protein